MLNTTWKIHLCESLFIPQRYFIIEKINLHSGTFLQFSFFFFRIWSKNLGLNPLSLPKPVHKLESKIDICKFRKNKLLILSLRIFTNPCYFILFDLKFDDIVNLNDKMFWETKHAAIEAKVFFSNIDPSKVSNRAYKATTIILIDCLMARKLKEFTNNLTWCSFSFFLKHFIIIQYVWVKMTH